MISDLALKFSITLILSGLLSFQCSAQDFNINTDRPDQSDGVMTVPKYHFQIEEGVLIAKETVVNNLMVRYGVGYSTEVRLILDWGKEYNQNGIQPLTLSIKQKLIKQNKIFPAISLIGDLSAGPWASKDYTEDNWSYSVIAAFENELTEKFSLGYNVGTSNQFKNLNLAVNLGYSATKRFSGFVEYFSTFSGTRPIHNYDLGVLYLVKPNLQIDLAYGQTDFIKDSSIFTTLGFSYLFKAL